MPRAIAIVSLSCTWGKLAALGTLKELEASLGGGSHTLDEAFVHYAGATLDSGGSFRDVSAEQTTEQRLG